MKKNIVLVAAMAMALFAAACGGGGDVLAPPIVPLELSGTITIQPDTDVTTGTELTAVYDGPETVTYQWNKDGAAVSGAENSEYTPEEAGSYTVTVSAAGYNSKTSDPVTVTQGSPSEVTVQGADLAAKLAWIKANAQSNVTYLVTVDKDEVLYGVDNTLNDNYLSYEEKKNITVQLQGTGGEKTITLSSDGSLFTIGIGVTLILDKDITLKGNSNNIESLVISNGALEMKTGAKITGNIFFPLKNHVLLTNRGGGGGVHVGNGGTFIMSGGEISGNKGFMFGGGVSVNKGTFTMNGGKISGNEIMSLSNYSLGGGVYVGNGGTFTMSGGEISGNIASPYAVEPFGGGVYVESGTYTWIDGTYTMSSDGTSFTMSGGKISGNTAAKQGGGVYVAGKGTFTMSGGEISGNTAGLHGEETPFVIGDVFHGGGVFVESNLGTFTKSGGGTITGYASDTVNGNIVKNKKGPVNLQGHAVYISLDIKKRRETTAGPEVNLDSSKTGVEGGWED